MFRGVEKNEIENEKEKLYYKVLFSGLLHFLVIFQKLRQIKKLLRSTN